MQPFPAALAGPLARWYTSPVPPPSSSRTPGPLANLPRPLDERERGRGRGRRVASVIGLAALVGVTAVLAHAVLPAMVSPVGEVAGAAATAEPAPVAAVITAAPSTRPTLPVTGPGAVPSETPAPAIVGPPVGRGPIPVLLPAAALTGYRWPLAHGRITLPFGPTPWGTRVVDGKLFHDGIDLATFCGDRVVAAHAGKVIAVGRHFDDAMGWVGDLRPYYRRLDAKHLWYELPIVVVVADGNGYRSTPAAAGLGPVGRGVQAQEPAGVIVVCDREPAAGVVGEQGLAVRLARVVVDPDRPAASLELPCVPGDRVDVHPPRREPVGDHFGEGAVCDGLGAAADRMRLGLTGDELALGDHGGGEGLHPFDSHAGGPSHFL